MSGRKADPPVADWPELLSAAVASYRDFAGAPVPTDAKGFAAHHAACKAALAHVEVLLRLGRSLNAPPESDRSAHEGLVTRARAALRSLEDRL